MSSDQDRTRGAHSFDAGAPAVETPRTPERTIGQLVADASADLSAIIRGEIQLAKAEVTKGLTIGGKGVGMLVGAGLMGLFGLIYLLHAAARGIGVFLPVWAGYLIVAAVLFLVAGILALLGIKSLKKAKPVPERAIKSAKDTVDAVKHAAN
ncbi:phage holin family protein [Janibacter massiliensis]|uniref:phage holin family protein n=1 Tax=Janibacter massiliensis TaxID=2058291 RepID=UPI000D1088D6|nr:phage holin family protein [Janibacter massiliensis]